MPLCILLNAHGEVLVSSNLTFMILQTTEQTLMVPEVTYYWKTMHTVIQFSFN